MTIELTDRELDLLTLALGMAAGQSSDHKPGLFRDLLRLANTVHRNNPKWKPYEVPDEASA